MECLGGVSRRHSSIVPFFLPIFSLCSRLLRPFSPGFRGGSWLPLLGWDSPAPVMQFRRLLVGRDSLHEQRGAVGPYLVVAEAL